MKKLFSYGLTFTAGAIFGAVVLIKEFEAGRLELSKEENGKVNVDYDNTRG